MSMFKRFIALALVLFMFLGLAPLSAFAATETEEFIRVFHLDVGRKYFTVAQVTELIDLISAKGYTHMELAIGNDGLRFLLDDMSVTVNGTTYDSDTIKEGVREANADYSHSGEWSQTEMDSIMAKFAVCLRNGAGADSGNQKGRKAFKRAVRIPGCARGIRSRRTVCADGKLRRLCRL